jgi:Cu-processing system ATP-binding protein
MICVERLTKRFGSREAVRDLSVAVGPGEVVAVVGPNGAGKSTLLKAVVGIVRPTGGRITVGGHDVEAEAVAARRLVGYVPQRLAFPDHVTPLELCRLVGTLRGVGASDADAGAALDAVALRERARSGVRDLSGGQRQRLSLALALVGAPRALVFDEPSISLDADGAEVVRAAIFSAKTRGAAILFATHHQHEVAALADRVVVLSHGQAVARAGAAEIQGPGGFEAFYRDALRREVSRAA